MTDGPVSSAADGRPADRYGDDRRGPYGRAGLVALSVVLAGAVGWWLWIAAVRSTPAVTWSLVGFGEVTSTSVQVRWTVDRDPATPVECVLRARGAAGEEVGRARVPVAPGGGSTVEVRHTLVTAALPVTGEVLLCTAAGA